MLISRIEESRIAQPPEENFWQDFCLLSFVLCSAFLGVVSRFLWLGHGLGRGRGRRDGGVGATRRNGAAACVKLHG